MPCPGTTLPYTDVTGHGQRATNGPWGFFEELWQMGAKWVPKCAEMGDFTTFPDPPGCLGWAQINQDFGAKTTILVQNHPF